MASGSFVRFVPASGAARTSRVGQIVVAVGHTSRRTQFLLGTQTFSTAGARVRFRRIRDINHDGSVSFDDVAVGARVRLSGHVIEPRRTCRVPVRVLVRRVTVRRR